MRLQNMDLPKSTRSLILEKTTSELLDIIHGLAKDEAIDDVLITNPLNRRRKMSLTKQGSIIVSCDDIHDLVYELMREAYKEALPGIHEYEKPVWQAVLFDQEPKAGSDLLATLPVLRNLLEATYKDVLKQTGLVLDVIRTNAQFMKPTAVRPLPPKPEKEPEESPPPFPDGFYGGP